MKNKMKTSGILLHISSLPGAYGIGGMGREAYEFTDFLKKAGQSYWQILPICPPGFGNSPYQAFSAFAGNPYLIDPEQLAESGLLLPEELPHWEPTDKVDFSRVYPEKDKLFSAAFARFRKDRSYQTFLKRNRDWLPEYALFMAVKDHFGGVCWLEWEADIRSHAPEAVARYTAFLQEKIDYHCFLQYEFDRQWRKLHSYAKKNGIRILGDIPIYVPLDSADVWACPENYRLDSDRRPEVVAGCPPDGFSETGQYWGNPIYDWARMERSGFDWWLRRVGSAAAKFDAVRIDHFRGIESYWSIPAEHSTAQYGHWEKGPGMALIDAIRKAYPKTEFIAEDLGFLTPEVLQLVADSGFPGMKVLEFAFDPREPGNYLPHLYGENCVCYTGTHDNETLCQWCEGISPESRTYAREYLGISPEADLADAIITAGMRSNARLFVAQMQDYLRLGGNARMNEPGTLKEENWRWRMLPGAANDKLAEKIAAWTLLRQM